MRPSQPPPAHCLQFSDFRGYLQAIFLRRVRINPRYSMRAMARDLGVSHSKLSEYLSARRRMTDPTARKIAAALGLAERETIQFLDLVASTESRVPEEQNRAARRVGLARKKVGYSELSVDVHTVIAHWHHFAFLELMEAQPEQATASTFAKRFALPLKEARAVLNRLERVGLATQPDPANERWQRTGGSLTTTENIPSDAIRETNRLLMTKALEALERHPVEERDFSTITMAIHPEKLDAARRRITDFRRELASFLEEGTSRHEVYALAIQLFRLTEKQKETTQGENQ